MQYFPGTHSADRAYRSTPSKIMPVCVTGTRQGSVLSGTRDTPFPCAISSAHRHLAHRFIPRALHFSQDQNKTEQN